MRNLPILLIFFLLPTHYLIAEVRFVADTKEVRGYAGSDKISWIDSQGWVREAYFSKSGSGSDRQDIGFINKFSYQIRPGKRIDCEAQKGAEGEEAMCFTVNHFSGKATSQRSDGFQFDSHPQFVGKHHLVYRTSFWQYATNQSPPDSPAFLVTIDWVFMDGMDHFLYCITYDCSKFFKEKGKPFINDCRSPYTSFDWDGNGIKEEEISGFEYGTDRKFVSHDMLTYTSTNLNSIPYVWQYRKGTDAEIGYVQTTEFSDHRGGGEGWGVGVESPAGIWGGKQPEFKFGSLKDVDIWRLHYQMNGYQDYKDNRITWGLPYGSVDGGFGSTPPYQSYSLMIQLGSYSSGGVKRLVQETETVFSSNVIFDVFQGKPLDRGYEGVANPNLKGFRVSGYDPVYRVWRIRSEGTGAGFRVGTRNGSLRNPLFMVENMSQIPTRIKIGDRTAKAGRDYYLSWDSENSRIWLTLLRTVTDTIEIRVE